MSKPLDPISYVGLWWESSNEAFKWYGTVSFDPKVGGRLIIMGTFKNIEQSDIDLNAFPNIIKNNKIEEKKQIPLIFGITDSGKHMTLIDCIENQFTYTVEKQKVIYKTTYVISRIIIGVHCTKIKVKSLLIRYSHR